MQDVYDYDYLQPECGLAAVAVYTLSQRTRCVRDAARLARRCEVVADLGEEPPTSIMDRAEALRDGRKAVADE